eukprot:jgi/Astpho2/2807/Aster-00972
MLDALQDFSKKRRLTVNLEKTEVLVFELRHTPCRDFTYGGRVLTRKDSFEYLGLWFHATQRDFRLALRSLAASARKAMHAMRRRCFQLGYVHPQRMCNLFNEDWCCPSSAMAARGRPASAPSTERHERLYAENSDSTVATYRQMRGFTAAQTGVCQAGLHGAAKSGVIINESY